MKKLLGLLTILAVLGSTTTTFASYDSQNHLHLFLGQKLLDSNDWIESTDTQLEYAVDGDFNINNLPFNISFSYSHSEDDSLIEGVALTSETSELRVGARKYLSTKNNEFSWFFGGGLANINAKASVSALSIEDSSIGIYGEVGSQYKFDSKFYIGTKVAYSVAEVNIDGIIVAAGGFHYGLFVNIPFKL
tara:strand:+ start:116 stop:685 length:570 start_codon:yes stop_codon:yes gene_type:complete